MQAAVIGLPEVAPLPLAPPARSFAGCMCSCIGTHSAVVAENCRPLLDALGVDALMERAEGSFTVQRHTQLISALTELEDNQLCYLIANPDPSMSPQERTFYQHHLRLARYVRLSQQTIAQAQSGPFIPDVRLIRERCHTYFDMQAWAELVSLIRSSRDADQLDILVQDCFRRIVDGRDDAFDPIERAFAAYRGMENNTSHIESIALCLSDYRALRALESVLERVIQSNDDAAIPEAVAIVTALSGRCHMPSWTHILTVTENRASFKGYKRIIDVLLNRNLVERAEEMVLAISDEYEKGRILFYLARQLLERENTQVPLGREILLEMINQLSRNVRESRDPDQMSSLIETAFALADRLPTEGNCQSNALEALQQLTSALTADERALYVDLSEAEIENEYSSEANWNGVVRDGYVPYACSFSYVVYDCMQLIKKMFLLLCCCHNVDLSEAEIENEYSSEANWNGFVRDGYVPYAYSSSHVEYDVMQFIKEMFLVLCCCHLLRREES